MSGDDYYRAQDIQPLLDTFGVPVVMGEVTAKGIFNDPSEKLLADTFPHISGASGTVLVKTGTFPLATGAAIMVNDRDYVIADFAKEQDGAVTRAVLVDHL
jgi:hypothetical protein